MEQRYSEELKKLPPGSLVKKNVRGHIYSYLVLRDHRVLSVVVLTGSWCLLLYGQYFGREELSSGLRTRDMDFLVPIPVSLRD
jgi:hypothetical protein